MAAIVMMGGDEKPPPPFFHDFLGSSCGDFSVTEMSAKRGEKGFSEAEASESLAGSSGGYGLVSRSSDLGSGPEASMPSTTFSGRKRSNPDSAYTGPVRDRTLPVGSNSTEMSHILKMIRKEMSGERLGKSHDEMFSIHRRPPSTSSLIPSGEQSLPNGPMMHCSSRLGQTGKYTDKLSSPYTYKDGNPGNALISQAAADEGSRTGIKGSQIINLTDPSIGAYDKNSTVVLPWSNRPRAPQNVGPESSIARSHHKMISATRQMTIFYAGQAHVFDDVHQNKADMIMGLAGSNGGSWSTIYSPNKSNLDPIISEAKLPPSRETAEVRACDSTLFIQRKPDSDAGNPPHVAPEGRRDV